MNICFFTDIAILGGGEIWVLNAARVLRARGHSVTVVCPYRSPYFHACQERGVDVYAYYNGGGAPFHEPLYHALRNRGVDVVYCTVVGGFCEVRALEPMVDRLNRERGGSKAVLILKTGLPPGLAAEYYGAGAGPTVRRLHVVSEDTRRRFLDAFPEISQGLDGFIRVVREGCDLGRFDRGGYDRGAARRAWGVPEDHKLVACIARLHPTKGQDNLLLAATEVVKRFPRTLFLLAGEGDDRARLEQLRDHLGLAPHVRFAGHVEDVAPLLAATDVLCHPSLLDGLPNAVVEAAAMAVPVVASEVGGIPEIIEHGRSGLLVPPHDIHGLVAALGRMLGDQAAAAAMGEAGRGRVTREFSLEANTIALEERLACELHEFNRAPAVITAPPAPPARTPVPVLFLMSVLRTGGEESELAILARYLDREKFRPCVLSAWAAGEAAPVLERLARLGVPVDTACQGMSRVEEKVGYILHKIRRESIRVVVACQDTLLAYYTFQHLDAGECRLIEHAGIVEEVTRIPKDRTARLIGVSREITARAAAVMPRGESACFLPAMVDPAEFEGHDRTALRRAYGFGDDCVVTFIGRLDAKKGIDLLIDAAAEILPRHPRVRFLIVGGVDAYQPETAARLMDRARPLCGNRFVFAGGRSDVARILAASDIFVLPSRGEGMSHAINEAGAAGLPVIAFDDGAAREQFEDGQAGILVPAGDTAGLARAIERLAADRELRARLGGRLRSRVLREYSAAQVVPQWEALLAEVAAGTQPVNVAPALRLLPDDHLLPFPAEIQIETNTACNATCIMCPYPEVSKELPPGRMDLDLFEHILAQCAAEKTLWRIEPFLNNEPFTDTRMVDWIALAKREVPHALVTVTTNGSLVTPKVTDRLIQTGLDAIWFSFNGATRETYESIMGLSFDKVKANIEYLLKVRPPTLRVFTNMIETAPMRGEIAENIRYWQSLGVQSGASPLVNRAGNVGNFAELNYRPVNGHPVRICELLYHKMYIGYNGDVLLCCMDWRRRVVLGNARQQPLREIWHGGKYRLYREQQERGRAAGLDLCRDCSYIRN